MSKKEVIVRETKRAALSLMHNVSSKAEGARVKGLLENYDPVSIINTPPEKIKTVTFIITRMVRFHGGQTSILHLGTELEELGVKVSYLSYKPQSVEEMEICAGSNLPEYKGRLYSFGRYMAAIRAGKISEPDVVVASSWDTVAFAKRFEKSYKMYFVQDYEPLFYRFGEEYLMCRSTYTQGLHMVSLGSWNSDMIHRECDGLVSQGDSLRLDVVDFPYDSTGYTHRERDYVKYAEKDELTIAVYLKYYGKRLPNLIPWMLINTAKKLEKKGITLKVLYFGEAKTFNVPGGKNLGQLTKAEMNDLYARADFGMVASMSNISLVPYEMHAAGLPVIEFADGTYPYFFGRESALLTKIGDSDIARLLYEAANDPERLEKMDRLAAEKLAGLGWSNTGRQFLDIMKSVVK